MCIRDRYKDVPGSSQWAPYVRIAVQQGWINGYTDGTFRPDNTVTLEEACTAALKLLGYKMTDLNGVFPTAQLNKAQELGLRNQLNRSQSEAMNYEDCALLLYNTLLSLIHISYTLGTAIAVKRGLTDAAECAAAIGEGLEAFTIPGSVAEQRQVGLGHGNLGARLLSEDTTCFAFLAGHESFAAAEGAIGIARTANKVRKTPLRVILNGLGKDAAYIISRINGFTYVQTEYDICLLYTSRCV